MPNEKIAETFVDNGSDGTYTNKLQIQWGAKGDAPDAPDGWVNQGYAHLTVVQEQELVTGIVSQLNTTYVILDASSMDHLIRVLKRIRKKTFEAEIPKQKDSMFTKTDKVTPYEERIWLCSICGTSVNESNLWFHAEVVHYRKNLDEGAINADNLS